MTRGEGAAAIALRTTTPDDLHFVDALEHDPQVRPWISPWTRERHAEAVAGGLHEHLVIERDGVPVGYAILHLTPLPYEGVPEGSIDLMRLAIAERGQGIGDAALRLLIARVAAVPHAPALSLDVLDDNAPARRLYTRHGFVAVGPPLEIFAGRPGRVMVRAFAAERTGGLRTGKRPTRP